MSRYLDTSTTIHMAKIMVQYGKMQSFLLSEIFTVTLWQDHYGKGNSRKFFWKKVPKMECLFVNRAKGPLLTVYVDDIKLVGKKQKIEPTWKVLMKDVDFELGTRMGEKYRNGNAYLCIVSKV